MRFRTFDHGDQVGRVSQTHAGDVYDVKRGAGLGSSSDCFFERGKTGVRFFYTTVTQVNVHGGAVLCGNAEHLDNFFVGCGGGVVDAHAFGERAFAESFFDAGADGC